MTEVLGPDLQITEKPERRKKSLTDEKIREIQKLESAARNTRFFRIILRNRIIIFPRYPKLRSET